MSKPKVPSAAVKVKLPHGHLPQRCEAAHTCMNHCRSGKFLHEPTLRVFSTSPQGSLFTKSMPVRGVPVGGNSTEASIIKYSTFSGLLCNIHVHRRTAPVRGVHFTSRITSVPNEDKLTVMLLYSSSNMSRKISSPWDYFNIYIKKKKKSLIHHTVTLAVRQRSLI